MESKEAKLRRLRAAGRRGGIKGGAVRTARLTAQQRIESARAAAQARWKKKEKHVSLFLIAEIGINHNGSLELAKQMIDASHAAGFDAVKFQKRTIDKVYTKEVLDSPRDSPWGKTTRAQKEGLELSRDAYEEIDRYCGKLGILWSASAWDVDSQALLRTFDLKFNKVASAMLGNKPLMRMIAGENKRTFISTGMAHIEEIDEAVSLFKQVKCPFDLMHCNSTYPLKDEEANLLCIPRLKSRYQCEVGWSGHETSVLKVCIAAVTLGATSIERHITLDKTMYGSDQAASIECHDLPNFVSVIRSIPAILGTGKKIVTESEWPVRKKLRVEAA